MKRSEAVIFVRKALTIEGSDIVDDSNIDQMISSALNLHSGNFPVTKVEDQFLIPEVFLLPIPADFQEVFSELLSIEYPGLAVPKTTFKRSQYEFHRVDIKKRPTLGFLAGSSTAVFSDPGVSRFFAPDVLIRIEPEPGANAWIKTVDHAANSVTFSPAVAIDFPAGTIRKQHAIGLFEKTQPSQVASISYTVAHVWTDETQTMPLVDHEAIAHLAASHVALAVSARFAQSGMPTVISDSADYRAKQAEWDTIAEKQARIYYDHFGIDPEKRLLAAFKIAVLPRRKKVIEDDRQLFPYMAGGNG